MFIVLLLGVFMVPILVYCCFYVCFLGCSLLLFCIVLGWFLTGFFFFSFIIVSSLQKKHSTSLRENRKFVLFVRLASELIYFYKHGLGKLTRNFQVGGHSICQPGKCTPREVSSKETHQKLPRAELVSLNIIAHQTKYVWISKS